MNITIEQMSTQIFDKDAAEVVEFLKEESPIEKTFSSKEAFLNYLTRCLVNEVRTKPHCKTSLKPDFWMNRKKSLLAETTRNKPSNMLYIIRLLNGTRNVPEETAETFDFYDLETKDDEEYFWEEMDRRREGWCY